MTTRTSIVGRRHFEQQQQQQQPRATTARINNDDDATVEPQPNRSATKHDTAAEEECASEKGIYVDKPIIWCTLVFTCSSSYCRYSYYAYYYSKYDTCI